MRKVLFLINDRAGNNDGKYLFARELGFSNVWTLNDMRSSVDKLGDLKKIDIYIWKVSDADRGTTIGAFVNYCSVGFSSTVLADFARGRDSRSAATFGGKFSNRLNYVRYSILSLSKFLSRDSKIHHKDSQNAFSRSLLLRLGQKISKLGTTSVLVNSILEWNPFLVHKNWENPRCIDDKLACKPH